MPSLSTWKIAYVSAFFAASSSAQSISASKTLPTPNVTIVQETSISRPTRNWISPEYKWFFEYPLPIPPQKSSKLTYTNKITQETIDYYEIELKPFMQQIYPNLPPTNLVGYDGISPGPQFTMQKGREAVVRFLNNSGSDMSVHVHGQYNRAPFDGWAADYAQPGQYKDYYYPNAQNARTIWYHDHTEYTTAEHAYRGQEGLYIITDAEEQSLGLPSGKYDIPLTLGAKTYGSNGQLIFDTLNNVGLWGDIIHV
jgi:bilirubin oxidase